MISGTPEHQKQEVIDTIEHLVEMKYYTLEEITEEIRDRLCHLWE